MKYLFCLFIILSCNHILKSQKVLFGLECGLGTYSMDGLKEINKTIPPQLGFNVKTVDDFPPTFYYRPFLSLNFGMVKAGFMHTFLSSGSRISAKDYSGEYRFDIIGTTHSPALHLDLKMNKNRSINSYLRVQGGINFTKLRLEEYLELNKEILSNQDYKLKSSNLFLEPAFYIGTKYKKIDLALTIGYHLLLSDNALKENNTENELKNPKNGNSITPNWDGVRTGLTIGYEL